jgi:hypothetical protein
MPRRSSISKKRGRATDDDITLTDAELRGMKPLAKNDPLRKVIEAAQAKKRGTDHDFATVARRVVEQAIGERLDGSPLPDKDAGKNPHAVALGKLGGQKGGKARAKALTKTQRVAIAKKAAKSRWG